MTSACGSDFVLNVFSVMQCNIIGAYIYKWYGLWYNAKWYKDPVNGSFREYPSEAVDYFVW